MPCSLGRNKEPILSPASLMAATPVFGQMAAGWRPAATASDRRPATAAGARAARCVIRSLKRASISVSARAWATRARDGSSRLWMTARRSSRPSRTSDGDGYASPGGRSSSSRQRHVVRVRWTVAPLRRSVVRGAFPPSADNGASYAYDGPLSPYDVPSYAAHFHRTRTTARRTRTMDRRPLTTFRRTRRIFIVRGQRRVVRVRWTVVPLRRSVVRGAFPSSADNGASYAYDGPLSAYDVPSYAAHFHRPRTTACRLRTTEHRIRRISVVSRRRRAVCISWRAAEVSRRSEPRRGPARAQVILVGSWEAGQRQVIAFAFPGSMSVVSDSAKRTVIRCGRPSFRAAGRGQANPWRPSPRPVAASSGRNRSAGTVSR